MNLAFILAAIQGAGDGPPFGQIALVALVVLVLGLVLTLARRYKRCPSNRILVIYGRTGKGRSSRPIHGGGALVWPLIQNYDYLFLDPMQIEIDLVGALSSENIRVNVPSVFTCLLYTSPSPRDQRGSRMPSSA